jgi:UV DNA damage endonuclease
MLDRMELGPDAVLVTHVGGTFEFTRFTRDCEGLVFDEMLEAKAKDLSLLKLRPDLLRYAPDTAKRFGILPRDDAALEAEAATLEAEIDCGA